MRILLVATEYNDAFTKGMDEGLASKAMDVDILSMKYRFFRKSGVIKNCFRNHYSFRLFELLCRIRFGFLQVMNISRYDIIHILGWKEEVVFIFPFLRWKATAVIVSIYGQDTFKSKALSFSLRFFNPFADRITFTSKSFYQMFKHYFSSAAQKKIIFCYLPLPVMQVIDRINPLPSEQRIHISCSTNRSYYDNHLQIINQISHCPSLTDKVQLNFLLSYGEQGDYYQSVLWAIKMQLGDFKISVIDNYLSEHELAVFRIKNKIFLNLRQSDQFSGAMMEALYAGCYVITGNWLPYQELLEYGVVYKVIHSIDELPSALVAAVDLIEKQQWVSAELNRTIIRKYFHPEIVLEQWLNLYLDCIKDYRLRNTF